MGAPHLALGIDVSPLRLGWGLVTLDDSAYVASGKADIHLPHHGWKPENVWDEFDTIRSQASGRRADIAVAAIELPWIRFPKNAFTAGRAVQAVVSTIAGRFPEAAVHELQPKEWRALAGLPGNATKDEVMAAAISLRGGVRSRREPQREFTQDEADGLMIAVAAQRLNAATWHRAVERGAA